MRVGPIGPSPSGARVAAPVAERLEVGAGAERAARAREHGDRSASSASKARNASASASAVGPSTALRTSGRSITIVAAGSLAASIGIGMLPLVARAPHGAGAAAPRSTAFRASRPASRGRPGYWIGPSCVAWSRSRGCTTPCARRARPSGSRAGDAGWPRARGAAVLDLGCGTGRNLPLLPPGTVAVGLDPVVGVAGARPPPGARACRWWRAARRRCRSVPASSTRC